jgi:ATP-dependent exoDNAse (exonuclease V) alpha subunit
MLAATRADVDALNVEARSALLERGLLGSEVATAADFELRLGDAVICTRNDRRLGVLNGTRGTVVHANMAGGVGLLVEGELVHLPAEYLAAGQLTYGYVTTVHKSQGETVERSFVLGSASLFREAGYVAMSRARIRTDLYVADSPFEDGLGPDVAFPDELTRSLRTSRAKFLALEEDARCQPQSKGEPEVERQRTEPDLGLGR